MALVLGVDAGGTATRAVLASTSGERLGRGTAAGGNPISHGTTVAADRIAHCVRQAIGAADPARIEGAVIGLAGRGALEDPDQAAVFDRMWRAVGLRISPVAVADPLLAFLAGTRQSSGSVLLAGTGAAAVRVRDLEVAAIADGAGWLLGDEGSGFWLGRAAARATIRQWAEGRPGALARLVAEAFAVDGGSDRVADAIASRAHGNPVATLAPLAPLVQRAATAGDPAAVAIVGSAAERLMRTLGRVRSEHDGTPIVLAGGVLIAGGPVRERVEGLCARHWKAPVSVAGDSAAAAARLAAIYLARPSGR